MQFIHTYFHSQHPIIFLIYFIIFIIIIIFYIESSILNCQKDNNLLDKYITDYKYKFLVNKK